MPNIVYCYEFIKAHTKSELKLTLTKGAQPEARDGLATSGNKGFAMKTALNHCIIYLVFLFITMLAGQVYADMPDYPRAYCQPNQQMQAEMAAERANNHLFEYLSGGTLSNGCYSVFYAVRDCNTRTQSGCLLIGSFWLYYEPVCPAGSDVLTLDGVSYCPPSSVKLSISAAPPIIPAYFQVLNKKVHTKSDLVLTLTKGGQPEAGVSIELKSDRGTYDVIDQPSVATDASGTATAAVKTWFQPATSIVTATNPDIQTAKPGVVKWLPAKYQLPFQLTCYDIANESDPKHIKSPLVSACGDDVKGRRFHQSFLRDARRQGSGQTSQGDVISPIGLTRCFKKLDGCALTKTMKCVANGMIAVDPKIIPLKSSINIELLGLKKAEDVGGDVKDYHIDVFMGAPEFTRADCDKFGRNKQSNVTFINY